MGKCILSFDQIELITKKSDTKHSDNDWMFITWFVGDKVVRTDYFPLLNADGSTVLDSGNAILPFTSEVDCHDNQLAVATFQIVNLGSFDPSDQVNAVGDIAESGSQEIAKIYMKEIELYLRYSGYVPGAPSLPGPLSDFLADKVEEFAPIVVKAIGTLFEDVIIPLLQDLMSEIDVILGHPNCNGEVLHDAVVFKPSAPIPDLSLDQIYEAGHVTGCGSAARTRVHLTQHRELDEQPKFDNTPPPQVSLVPSQSKNWPGTWAEDPNTPTPVITVAITPSQKAAGSYSVEIVERVDPRFNIQFQAAGDPVAPRIVHVPPFNGNVMGKVRPWVEHPLAPTQLSVVTAFVKASLKNAAGTPATIKSSKKPKTTKRKASARTVSTSVMDKVGGKNVTSAATSRMVFKLGWQNSQPLAAATLTPVKFGAATTPGGGSGALGVFEQANGIQLPAQGVTLVVYDAVAVGKTVGPAVRYIRDQNMSFTRADVMLVLWDPVH